MGKVEHLVELEEKRKCQVGPKNEPINSQTDKLYRRSMKRRTTMYRFNEKKKKKKRRNRGEIKG